MIEGKTRCSRCEDETYIPRYHCNVCKERFCWWCIIMHRYMDLAHTEWVEKVNVSSN